MQPSAPIAEYLDALARELRFDPRLSRRVRREVEDHLWEAVADGADANPQEAARLAIARFGDPRLIARQYAPLSLLRQTRRVGGILILAIAAILILMKGRVALYEFLQWPLKPDWLGGLGAIAPVIDRHMFQLSLVLGILGWLYIAGRRPAPAINDSYRQQLQRSLLLSAAASALLIGAVVLDTILGGLRIVDAGMSPAALVPLLSIAAEIGLVGIITMELRKMMQRQALVSSMFTDKNASR
jgi:hypothetical protein